MDSTPSASHTIMVNPVPRRKPLQNRISSVDTWEKQAVCVRNACKAYGKKKNKNIILDNLNMTVPRNTIYGLLGASGCGKTTLLSCIIGRKQLDSGEILVLGGKPGSRASGIPGPKIGYMPQDISLFGEFTIRETLLYFGWISGMTTKEIDEKLQFLTQFLLLPSKNSFVKNLSGGQQRRVSLSVALVHDPELLILDEPTVGVDPILRENIWEHLVEITKRGNKTIILTTHYIDEMKSADNIALMRGGYFIAEDTPSNLMNYLEADNLEDAYLKLSIIQSKGRVRRSTSIANQVIQSAHLPAGIVNNGITLDDEQNNEISGEFGDNISLSSISAGKRLSLQRNNVQNFPITPEYTLPMTFCDYMKLFNSKHLVALMWKNFMWMWRNKPMIAFVIILPLFQMSMFSFAIGGDPKDVTIAVKNYELNDWQKNCPFQRGCNATYLSCRYLKHLEDKNFILKYVNTKEEADNQVEKGKVYASIVFPTNYSQSLQNRIDQVRSVSDWDLDNSMVYINQDRTNEQIAILLWKDFNYVFFDYIQEYLQDCKYSKKVVEVPIKFNKPIYGASLPNYTDFAAPGAVLTMAFFLAMAITAGGIIIERKEGSYERLLVAGVSELEMLLSHIISDFFVVLAQVIMMLIVTFGIWSMTNEGSIYNVFSLVLLTGISGMAFGYFISGLCDNEQTATSIALGLFFPIIMLCGMIWPREGMPYFLQIVSCFLPLTKNTDGLRSILHRGWGLDYPLVYEGYLYTFLWTLLMMVLSVIVLKLRKS